jgi:lipocalin-like protein
MKSEKLIFEFVIMFIITVSADGQSNSLKQFKGMWRLEKYEAFDSISGKWKDAPKRIGYSGYILYDGTGHMGVQLFPPDFNKLNDSTSIDSLNSNELKKIATIQSKYFTYFGNCTISAGQNVIEHHIRSSNHPSDIGTTVKWNFEFKGDTLILTAEELIGGSKTRLRWVKCK